MNRHAQTLVLFVLIIPLLIALMVGIVEIGNILVEKKDLASRTKMCLTSELKDCYSLNNITVIENTNQFIEVSTEVKSVILKSKFKVRTTVYKE